MPGNNHFRFLFHVHTSKSFDATTSIRRLLSIAAKHNVTHLAITEHNNFDSYARAREMLPSVAARVELVPAVEYTTEAGDIIVLFVDELIGFSTYQELLREARARQGIIVLPHPFNRPAYPPDLLASLDLYELANLRGPGKTFDPSPFNGVRFIFGSDAHHWFDLPGYVNNYYTPGTDLRQALLSAYPVPSLHRLDTTVVNKFSKLLSKIRRRIP